METANEQAKDIIEKLAIQFTGFASIEIGSIEYSARVEAMEKLVVSLAALHPRWSPEKKTIMPRSAAESSQVEAAHHLMSISEYIADLFRAWCAMNAAHPTANSLIHCIPGFTLLLSALVLKSGATIEPR